MADYDEEIINEFLIECNEHLDALDSGFVTLEQDLSDTSILSAIFRSIHTIKGGAGMLGFSKLEKLSHVAENLLSLLRDAKLDLNADMITVLLQTVDAIRVMLTHIALNGHDGEQEYQELIEQLQQLQSPPTAAQEKKAQTNKKEKPETKTAKKKSSTAKKAKEKPQSNTTKKDTVSDEQQVEPEELQTAELEENIEDQQTAEEKVKAEEPVKSEEQAKPEQLSLADSTIRINIDLLDKLMNLVGELVLSRNQILQYTSTQLDPNFLSATQRLNLITSELQEGVMKTRMQPIGNLWGKFPRLVRDLASSCQKKVKVELIGKDTELDKSLLEAIKDPLTHIIRNSVDHGIESPQTRLGLGKPEEGTLILKAFHEGGNVHIEIQDDGGGISVDKIKSKAFEKGLISADDLTTLSDREILNLIFTPGFSTAEKVTNVSGRGVGMDVVRNNIERINGSIDLESDLGKSTTLKIKIPLTMAIIPALIVSCHQNRYAIPQVDLIELVHLDSEQAEKQIQYIMNTPTYKLRGKMLPLVYLAKELGFVDDVNAEMNSSGLNIVVLKAGFSEFGLVVEDINDTQDIVVKPLSKLLKNIHCFSGATIMGDGSISLILDVMGVARKAGIQRAENLIEHKTAITEAEMRNNEDNIFLMMKLNENDLKAIPLDKVHRIEEFSLSSIEKAGSQDVVQYRNSIMPLIRLSNIIDQQQQGDASGEKVFVIVYLKDNQNMGLIVDYIFDIVEGQFDMHHDLVRSGILGTTVIQGKVTEVIDVESVIHQALPNYFTRQ